MNRDVVIIGGPHNGKVVNAATSQQVLRLINPPDLNILVGGADVVSEDTVDFSEYERKVRVHENGWDAIYEYHYINNN